MDAATRRPSTGAIGGAQIRDAKKATVDSKRRLGWLDMEAELHSVISQDGPFSPNSYMYVHGGRWGLPGRACMRRFSLTGAEAQSQIKQ